MAVLDVVVVDDENSVHADLVEAALTDAGASVVRLNCSTLSEALVHASPGAWRFCLNGVAWEVTSSSTIWYRRRGKVNVAAFDDEEGELARDEIPHVLLGGLLGTGARWVDDPFAVERAEQKLLQLASARALGITVPVSLVTNDPEAAAAGEGQRTVAKPLSPGVGIAPFVAEVARADLELVASLPVLLQHLVVADADLRVVVVGGVGWVWRRRRTQGAIDWRAVDPSGTEFELVSDEKLVRHAVHLTQALGLSMSVQDWLEVPGEVPLFLEANPQGAWAFLSGADARVPAALAKLLFPGPSGVVRNGVWPKPLHRIRWDLGSAKSAPENDGVQAPEIVPPSWIGLAARSPEALAVAQRANDEAKAASKAAEDKASRLAQTALATVAVATAIGAFQVGFALERSTWFILLVLPVALAAICLAISAFEAVEIDRVGLYGNAIAEDLALIDPRTAIERAIEREEAGRQLARWSSRKKHTSLMQARAWFSRGLVLLLVSAIVAAGSWGARVSQGGTSGGAGSAPTSDITTQTSTSTSVTSTPPQPGSTAVPSATSAPSQPTSTTTAP